MNAANAAAAIAQSGLRSIRWFAVGPLSPAVDDGIYVHVNPLAVGLHTLDIHAENPSQGFALDVTYNLTVVPIVEK